MRRNAGLAWVVACWGVACGQAAGVGENAAPMASVFANPLFVAEAADPSMVQLDGIYYYVKSTGSGVDLYQSETLAGLSQSIPTHILQLPSAGSFGDNCDLWAPELQYIHGAWWLYYAATSSDGTGGVCNGMDRNATHRMFVARANTHAAAGPWTRYGQLMSSDGDSWAIDGTTLQLANGALYFIWSGTAEGQPDGGFPQELFIAPMADPATLAGPRVMISSPTNDWERLHRFSRAGWINEAPEIIEHNGVVSLVFSANASWDNDYCLGMATLVGDPLDPEAWIKNDAGPVFASTDDTWGPGHHTFFTSPDGNETWIAFHAFNTPGGGWASREVRAQRIEWYADGTPYFGAPVSNGWYYEPSR